MNPTEVTTERLNERITDYLSNGGLINPEMMEHEKVRDLLMDCRYRLDVLACQRVIAVEALNELQDLRKDIIHGGGWTKKVDDLFRRAREAGFGSGPKLVNLPAGLVEGMWASGEAEIKRQQQACSHGIPFSTFCSKCQAEMHAPPAQTKPRRG